MAIDANFSRKTGLVLAAVAVGLLLWLLPWPWQVTDHGDPVTSAVLLWCSWLLWAVVLWAAVVVVVAMAGQAAGALGRRSEALLHRLAPAALRAVLATSIGVGAAIGLAGPAVAGAVDPSPLPTPPDQEPPAIALDGPSDRSGSRSVVLDLDWPEPSLDWPTPQDTTTTAAPVSAPTTAPEPATAVPEPEPAATEVVVLRGDTLWAIAARSLPAGASDAEIAAHCQQWHQTNREVIGGDPDLILPGQRLQPPTQGVLS